MGEENLPAKADELLTEVLNKDPLTLASISAVPYFGGTLSTFFSAKWLQIYQERTDALFKRFGGHLHSLDERTIKQDYFDTPEGIDLLIKATEQSSKTRSEEKRDLIARILCGATIEYEQDEHSPEDYLSLISDLTLQELKVARSIYVSRPENNQESWIAWEEQAYAEIGIPHTDLRFAVSRLGSTGLLHQVSFGKGEGGTFENLTEYGNTGFYRVTPAFDKLMRFLDLNA